MCGGGGIFFFFLVKEKRKTNKQKRKTDNNQTEFKRSMGQNVYACYIFESIISDIIYSLFGGIKWTGCMVLFLYLILEILQYTYIQIVVLIRWAIQN